LVGVLEEKESWVEYMAVAGFEGVKGHILRYSGGPERR